MPFPITSVIEAFTGTGALSGSWTAPVYTGDGVPERYLDNCVSANGNYGSAAWNSAFGVSQEAYCKIPSSATGSASIILWCKVKNPNTGTSCAYTGIFSVDGNTITIIRAYNNSETELVSGEALTVNPGDKVGMRVIVGSTDIVVELYTDSGSGWTLRRTVTDTGAVSSYPLLASTGGLIAFAFYGEGLSLTRCIDDFGGGTYVAVTLDNCLPDADTTTTGWTTAPLFSKVNDASDSTVIQATAV